MDAIVRVFKLGLYLDIVIDDVFDQSLALFMQSFIADS